jgi:pilus assembly protein CpaE
MRVVIAGEAGYRRERLRQAILGIGLECGPGDCVSCPELPGRLLQNPADLVLVCLDGTMATALPVIRQAVGLTLAPVLAIGPAADAEQVLQVLRHGAREYLHEETAAQELLAALDKLQLAGRGAPSWGEVLIVLGAKPGTGVTTVASNLAFALAKTHADGVVLAEMGGSVPELALDLNLHPTFSVADLEARIEELDATVVRQALVKHAAGLSVLVGAPDTFPRTMLESSALQKILVLLRTLFKFVVVDQGHSPGSACQAALEIASKVAVVFGLDVPSVRLTQELLRRMDDWNVPRDKVHLIANRYGQRKQFPWKQAQEALRLPIREWIPDDPARVNDALNQGEPLVQVAGRAGIGNSFFKLAAQMDGRPSSWPRLVG